MSENEPLFFINYPVSGILLQQQNVDWDKDLGYIQLLNVVLRCLMQLLWDLFLLNYPNSQSICLWDTWSGSSIFNLLRAHLDNDRNMFTKYVCSVSLLYWRITWSEISVFFFFCISFSY
jgi:hypothetical protein